MTKSSILRLCFFAVFLSLAAPAFAEDEWVVEQKDTIFYLSKNAVKAVNTEDGYEMIAKAPDWICYGYRRDKKIIWQTPMTSFNNLVFVRPFVDSKDSLRTPARFIGKATVSGFKCSEYQTLGGKLYGSEDIKLAPKPIEFVNRYLFTSTIPQIPLFYKQRRDDGKYVEKPWFDNARYQLNAGRKTLMTFSVKKKPYVAKDFTLPIGYKRITNAKDIAYSDAKKRQFEDVLEGVGFMSSDKEMKKH